MPTPVEFCQRCDAPIYVEDGVPGGCTCADGQLRGLLAARRSVQARQAPRVAETLPEIPPEVLLTGAALAEYRAMTAPRATPVATPPVTAGRRLDAQRIPDMPLEQLWMSGEELGDLGGEYPIEPVGPVTTASDDFDIDFDAGEIDFNSPRMASTAGRFRVDRAPSTYTTPRRFSVMADGGEMVGARSVMRDVARSEASAHAVPGRNFRETRQAAIATATQTPRASAPTPAPARPAARPPTAYERLKRGGGI